MHIQPDFPNDRRQDPRRRAELEVHNQLAASDLLGRAIYEARASAAGPEVDFAIWLQGQGRFALQVKGGRYSLQDGEWYLHTDDGPERKKCPLKEASDGAFSIRDAVKRLLGRKVFVVPGCCCSPTWTRTWPSRPGRPVTRRRSSGAAMTWCSGCCGWPCRWK